ncbi:unnamed protein product, partial [Symbiodinium necroappetens]
MEVAFIAPSSSASSSSLPTGIARTTLRGTQPESGSFGAGAKAAALCGAAAAACLATRRRTMRRAEQELATLPKHMQPVDMN